MEPYPRPPFWMFLPPPIVFVASFLIGLGIQYFFPLPLAPPSIYALTRIIGGGFILGAVSLGASAIRLFFHRQTTVIPHGEPKKLVTAGPYRFTRNPMYVGLTTTYLGVCVMLNLFWPVPFILVPLGFLQGLVIPFEERNLERIFGEDYLNYKKLVRRWI